MIIDRAQWHQSDDLPADLDPSATSTHIGMFVAWAILNGFMSDVYEDDDAELLEAVRARTMTGAEYLKLRCSGTLTDGDLTDSVQLFVREYYSSTDAHDEDNIGSSPYLDDYERTLAAGLPSLYHVYDTWDNYDLLAPVLDAAFAAWRKRT